MLDSCWQQLQLMSVLQSAPGRKHFTALLFSMSTLLEPMFTSLRLEKHSGEKWQTPALGGRSQSDRRNIASQWGLIPRSDGSWCSPETHGLCNWVNHTVDPLWPLAKLTSYSINAHFTSLFAITNLLTNCRVDRCFFYRRGGSELWWLVTKTASWLSLASVSAIKASKVTGWVRINQDCFPPNCVYSAGWKKKKRFEVKLL